MKRLIALLIAAILSVGAITPAKGADLIIVSGYVKTIDGVVVQNMTLTFRSKTSNAGFSAKVSADGKYFVQIPEGAYYGNLSVARSPSVNLCLDASFQATITQSTTELNVNLPRTKTYEFKFVDERNNLVPGVTLVSQNLAFAVPDNSDIERPYFFCNFATLRTGSGSSPFGEVFLLTSFEGAPSGDPFRKSEMTYKYLSGLGQTTSGSLAFDQSLETKLTVTLKAIPGLDLTAKNIKVSKRAVTGFATFSEVPAFVGLGAERTLRTSVRVLRKGKWSNWSLKVGSTGAVDAAGRVSINIPTKAYKATTIEVAVSGVNFNAASQIVRVKVPK